MVKLLVLLIVTVFARCVHLQTTEYRLPKNAIPAHYQITFTFDPNNFLGTNDTFNAFTMITLNIIEATSEIKLHSSPNTTINSASLTAGVSTFALTHVFDTVTDILTLSSTTDLIPSGEYNLTIDADGIVSTTDMYGIYRSSYHDEESNSIKYLLTTQLEPTYARRAFPCFDEPEFKATFTLIFEAVPSNLIVNANTKENDVVVPGLQTFITTPIMPTYLVAFTISEFDCTQAAAVGIVENRICSRKEAAGQRAWAADIAPKLLEVYNNYTNLNYGLYLDKLDQVAIPDFAAGAMENWGLATYREQYLLYDPNESTNRDKQRIAAIFSHEIAHQWFGNLVTMQWWSELFLNEGFADYFEYFGTHRVLPEWQMDRQFVVDTVQSALRVDEGSALPLQHNVSSPTEVMLMFNTISYSKGGSIFRMVEHVMGSQHFQTGLSAYLDLYKTSNTIPENLWQVLSNHIDTAYSKLPATLPQVMTNWVTQSGFPLLTVTVNNGEATITQKQFLLNGSTSANNWYVPISYTTSADENKFQSTAPQYWLTPDSAELKFNLTENATWIILNNLQTGYYRVNYDVATWNLIDAALKQQNFSNIDELNRAVIVDDLFGLAKANVITYSRIFQLLDFLKEDVSYFPWIPAITGFSYLLDRVGFTSQLGGYVAQHLQSNMEALYASTPFETINEEDQVYTFKQALALRWACYVGNADCLQKAQNLFNEYKTNAIRPNKNLRSTVYCTALRESQNNTDWQYLWNAYETSTLSSEKVLLLAALACTKDETLLEGYLNTTLTDSIRSQDRYSVFLNVVNNPYGLSTARKFFSENHAVISELYQGLNTVANILRLLASKVTNQLELDEVRLSEAMLQTFITEHLPAQYLVEGQRAIATAQANIQWLTDYEDDLRLYYESVEPNPAGGAASSITSKYYVAALITGTIYFLL